MHPIHDVDPTLLLAMMMASKRRPAELAEIIAAIDLSQEPIPSAIKLTQAFARLAEHGLISATTEGFSLTPAALEVVKRLPRKADTAERLFTIRERLRSYEPTATDASITLTEAQLDAAISTFRTSARRSSSGGGNQLMPKPKPKYADKPPGWRRDKAAAHRRD